MNRRAHVTEAPVDAFTHRLDRADLVGRRVRVLDEDLNPKEELGAWFVTGFDPNNTAHVIVAKVSEHWVENWSIHHGQLRTRA